MNNQQILNQITNPLEKTVFKSMRTDAETGKALLNPEQLGTFLRAATIKNTILADADLKLMKSFEKQLTRTGINGRVLQSGYDADGKTNEDLVAASPSFSANTLNAKKLKALCQIEDDDKEDIIGNYESTLLTMMGESMGEDIEFWALFADTDIEYATNSLLSTTDGWLKRAQVVVKSKGVQNSKGNPNVEEDGVEALFDEMINSLSDRFRQKRANLKFYVPYEVEDAYRNLLKSRGTNLGDTTQTGFNQLAYKGIPIVYCPTLDDEVGRGLDNTASCMLTDPKNLAYGIYKDVTIEPERVPAKELTKYWYRLRGDINFYFNEATVVGKISTDEAAALPAQSKA